MEDLKQLMQQNYIKYASYVILDRSIPHVVDGLKPVQRRILHTLFKMDDGKLHKVANVVGQTMAFHPHGDAPINDALVNMAVKDLLFDLQGNFGNIFTGDPAAAARYIETRLSKLAKETMFNPDLTQSIPSYDGRNMEPVTLPAKIPLLLIQGAEGIAVGMATKILPHNFTELLEAEIAILEGKPITILPDFATGGIMDASEYDKGRGKVKLRAKISAQDDKTLVIKEICYGTTTESLVRSIDEAAKRGKIKIERINDYTAEKVEVEIKLPRGQHAQSIINQLYAFTDCEVSISSQIIVIKDNLPWETDVEEILRFHVENLQKYLRRELEIESERIEQKIFERTLEQLFIENRLYKDLEKVSSADMLNSTVEKSLKPYHSELSRLPKAEDIQRLLAIPIRRISRFDIDKNQDDIEAMRNRLKQIDRKLKNMKKTTIDYLKDLIKRYGKDFSRKTSFQEIVEIDKKAMATRELKVGLDPKAGYIGTKVNSENRLECTNYDKLLLIYSDGTYTVINIPEKLYVAHNGKAIIYMGIADKKTIFRAVYTDPKSSFCYAKRFVVSKFILEKTYEFFEPGMKLETITTRPDVTAKISYKPKARQKVNKSTFDLDSVAIKGVSAKGIRIANKEVKKVTFA
ncbi:MAG: topoisomerase-4 subunit A [Chlamydiales bacterium]|jgi:topoisomerase-4 subunit A